MLTFKKTALFFVVTILIVVCICVDAHSQVFLRSTKKGYLYYANVGDSTAIVFKLGRHLDKAGAGYSIVKTDTLTRQQDGNFQSEEMKLIGQDGKVFLKRTRKKKEERIFFDTLNSVNRCHRDLNNGFFLDRYFKMTRELNTAYPQAHYSFRDGFYAWDSLQNKEIEHAAFREFTWRYVNTISERAINLQHKFSSTSNYIRANLTTLDYAAWKDSLLNLPPPYRSESKYFIETVKETAAKQPEYILKLAEEYPQWRSLIFVCVENDKKFSEAVKKVDGHEEIKKEFVKHRRSSTTMLVTGITSYVVVGGLLVWLLVGQP